MTDPRRILLAVRIGEASAGPATTARWLARELGGRIVLVYVASELRTATEVATATGRELETVRAQMTFDAEARARQLGEEFLEDVPFDVRVVEGEVAEAVAAAGEEVGAHLIVVGSRGRGALQSVVLGDTTRDILRAAKCPVVVVPFGREGG